MVLKGTWRENIQFTVSTETGEDDNVDKWWLHRALAVENILCGSAEREIWFSGRLLPIAIHFNVMHHVGRAQIKFIYLISSDLIIISAENTADGKYALIVYCK